jgi:hypothetical protein
LFMALKTETVAGINYNPLYLMVWLIRKDQKISPGAMVFLVILAHHSFLKLTTFEKN